MSASRGGHSDVVCMLLSKGANPDLEDKVREDKIRYTSVRVFRDVYMYASGWLDGTDVGAR